MTTTVRLPFWVLEVKLATDATPPWLSDLLTDAALVPVPKFSKVRWLVSRVCVKGVKGVKENIIIYICVDLDEGVVGGGSWMSYNMHETRS